MHFASAKGMQRFFTAVRTTGVPWPRLDDQASARCFPSISSSVFFRSIPQR